ncbi:hypothetical protein BGW80DRAFT_1305743 [Lactifluus volemus]|nr:hypothetical protein BGW80DRAFT_1305743 [Lactifluus volemus]
MKGQCSCLTLQNCTILPLLRPTHSWGVYNRYLCINFQTHFSRPPKLKNSPPLLSLKPVWAPTVLTSSESDSGGLKDVILEVKGAGAYDMLRWESGVHRVQRVPATEASGRVHTSTVAAVVSDATCREMPSNGTDDLLRLEDVRVEVMRARGAGGQHVNKTESAVRLTHVPSGITVSMQDERSQHQNKRRAFQVLRARLMDIKLIRDQAERRATRKSLVRTADRSEKIRTYNYPQNRVTDHRLGKGNMVSCEAMMEGDGLEMLIDELREKYLKELLREIIDQN